MLDPSKIESKLGWATKHSIEEIIQKFIKYGFKIFIMKVSILLSVFNNEQTVEKAIRSILNQTMKDYELLIMDDCSVDNSYNICKEFEDNIKVKVFRNNSNIGLTKSLNILASNSDFPTWQGRMQMTLVVLTG